MSNEEFLEKIAKLPLWARQHIQQLQTRVDALREEVSATHGEPVRYGQFKPGKLYVQSAVEYDGYGSMYYEFGGDPHVLMPDGKAWIELSAKGNTLDGIPGVRILSDGLLSINPVASNVAYISGARR